eukprot:g13129.t1
MIISRLLIIALGILWILLLLIIGGALGVDAASVPVTGSTQDESSTLAYAPSSGDVRGKGALLGEAIGWHKRGAFEEAAAVYSKLLEVVPNDPDGLHLLGLVRYGQGKLLDKNPEGNDECNALFEEAVRLVKSAVSFASISHTNTFSMRSNLGEILRANGDLEGAVAVLRGVAEEQEEAGIQDHQTLFNLGATLVQIVRRADSLPRGHPLYSEDLSKYLSRKHSKERRLGSEEWELRLEAQHILLRDVSRRPGDKGVMLQLAALFMSNWGVDRNGEKGIGDSQHQVIFDDVGGIYYDRDGNILEGFFDDSMDDLMDAHGRETTGRRNWGAEAVLWLDRALALDPSDDTVALDCAAMLHRLGRTDEARVRYVKIINAAGAESGVTREHAMSNLQVLKQESGDYEGAVEGYREMLVHFPENAVALNNLGAALHALEEHEEGIAMLEKSMRLDPLNPGVAEGMKRNDVLLVRQAIMLHPVMAGEHENVREIENLATALDDLIGRDPPLVIAEPARVERIHFYLVYRGGNQRPIQEKVARMYTRATPGLLHITPSLEKMDDSTEPLTLVEPHGMLLEGVMRHLPRKQFHVTVCPINAPGKRVSSRLADAADEVVPLPTKLELARNILGGNPSIDYFVSADVMENQQLTTLSKDDETYSEQVVLLGGQGIWYSQLTQGPSGLGDLDNLPPGSTSEASKAVLRRDLKSRLGVEEDSVIYICSQSLFKLRPDFDLVLRDILVAFDGDSDNGDNYNQSPESAGTRSQQPRKEKAKPYLVLTEGRRKGWTEAFWRRLQSSVPEIIPQARGPGEDAPTDVGWEGVPQVAGVGRRVPVVAMEGDALPGRMAFSLYKTMGLEGIGDRGCCVAKDRDSYVQLAVRLGQDALYREWAGDLISQRSAALWERRDVVFEWARFISRAAGRPSPAAQEVGLVEGADLPLPPPKPFKSQHQGRKQRIAQDQDQQLSQTPPLLALTGDILQLCPARAEQGLSSLPTNSAVDDATDIIPPTADSSTNGYRRTADDGQEDHSTEVHPAGDHDRSKEGQLVTSLLLERFTMLHREGRLEEAAATLQDALDVMEKKRLKAAKRKKEKEEGSPRQDTKPPGGRSNVREEGKAPYSGSKDSKEAQSGEPEDAAEASVIAGVMNDLGCTLQQLGEAELWYREALRLSPTEERDSALTNLVLLMRADGNRLKEAIDFIIRETSTPPLNRGGAIIAALSLLQPRPTHRQAFRRLGEGDDWSKRFGRSTTIWEEVRRLRELYPVSTNNLVVFLGLLDGLGGVLDVLWDVAGMEPLFFPEDEQSLLPQELHAPQNDFVSIVGQQTARGGRRTEGLVEGEDKPGGGVYGDGGGRGSEGDVEIEQERQRRGKVPPYDHHSVHVVTQYYIPDDPSRAREIDVCLLQNIQNPFVGTVHIFVDPNAVRLYADQKDPDGADASSWVETNWRPPVLEGLEEGLAGKARVIRISPGGRMTFADAIRYCNQVLSDRVVLLSNSDIAFDESLARLGDPYTLDMANKVFALAAWQSKVVSANQVGHPASGTGEVQETLEEHVLIGKPEFSPRTDSQDTWIFRSPLPSTVADATDFEMGRPRCDGRLAQVLLDAGYSVTSPSLSLVTRHVHAPPSALLHNGPSAFNRSSSPSSWRTSTYRGDTQVAGDVASVPISDQWLF